MHDTINKQPLQNDNVVRQLRNGGKRKRERCEREENAIGAKRKKINAEHENAHLDS